MKFPVTVEFYDQRAKVYAPAQNFPFYRVAFKVAGKRRMLTFGTYGEAKKAAEDKVKELHKGQQSSALTAKQAQDALTVHEMLAAYRQETGKLVSIVEMTGNYLSAVKQLPKGCSLIEAVRVYRQSIAAVQRKPLAEAVKEFCDARRPKGVPVDGKRSVLSPVYVQDTERQLTEFSDANTGADVCDLTKQHLDLFVESHAKLSPKSRNHYRGTLRMFFGWCQRRDYLAANHRLLEADGLRKEDADSRHTLSNTGPRRFLICEFDTGTADDHAAILIHLAGFAPLVCVVHSGGKSCHGWFYVHGQPAAMVKKFFRYAVSLGADKATWTPSQFVRIPDGTRDNGKRQTVFYINFKPLEAAQ